MQLHLDDEQADELRTLLTHALGELSSEIADTDNAAFQRSLRDRRRQLQSIAQQLEVGRSV
jgi:hypothetical protein